MSPLPMNPVKAIREQLGLTVAQLEVASKVHRQVIIRAEQGCYARIPPKLHSYLLSRIGYSNPSLDYMYLDWVDTKRHFSSGRLDQQLPRFDYRTHPFVAWREASGLNRIGVCKNFCVHPGTLSRFETKLEQQTLPEQLIEALKVAGYSSILDDLAHRYFIYREYKLAERSGIPERLAQVEQMLVRYNTSAA